MTHPELIPNTTWADRIRTATQAYTMPVDVADAIALSVNPELKDALKAPIRAAAVLIAITDEPSPKLVLTKRAEHLKHHPGQISFPGGAYEPGDADFVATALREADEEIAIPPEKTELLGFLPPALTISNYCMIPVIAKVSPDIAYKIDPQEVHSVVEVPCDLALTIASYESMERQWGQQTFMMHSFRHQEHLVWGATSAVLYRLATLMQA